MLEALYRILYHHVFNKLFEEMSGYSRDEILGQPHNLIRHPDMPHCIFKLFWDSLQQQNEIFAYVKNMHLSGDHYWVLAHVVPIYDLMGNHVGYHSNRRCPDRKIIQEMEAYFAAPRWPPPAPRKPVNALTK